MRDISSILSADLFTPFFTLYGALHVLGGVLIAFVPGIFDPVVVVPLGPGMAPLLGFLSALAGLGFMGAGRVEAPSHRRYVLVLAFIGNVANFAAHAVNALNGDEHSYMLWLTAAGCGSFAVAHVVLWWQLRRS